ncbi:hypothetical protein SSX86_005407 [Deinandra increscens subsp. villosa]|uniref:Uncharacterized protein n=1 Tax=Deinandra increscens subsp. villosa TaxID=3103831 RepID=A0AAP0DQW9_9ASTR
MSLELHKSLHTQPSNHTISPTPKNPNLKCKQRHPHPHPSPIKTNIPSQLPFQTSLLTTISMDQTLPETPPPLDHHSTVDTTRPFRSVKEAVAIFGDRLQVPETYSPSPKPPFTLPKHEAPILKSPEPAENNVVDPFQPERDQQHSPVVMNTLRKLELELHETKRELKLLRERELETEVALASLNAELHMNMSKIAKAEAEAAGKAMTRRSSSMTLRQVLSGVGGEREKGRERRYLKEKKVLKKKPVIPLVTDLFAWKNEKDIYC